MDGSRVRLKATLELEVDQSVWLQVVLPCEISAQLLMNNLAGLSLHRERWRRTIQDDLKYVMPTKDEELWPQCWFCSADLLKFVPLEFKIRHLNNPERKKTTHWVGVWCDGMWCWNHLFMFHIVNWETVNWEMRVLGCVTPFFCLLNKCVCS